MNLACTRLRIQREHNVGGYSLPRNASFYMFIELLLTFKDKPFDYFKDLRKLRNFEVNRASSLGGVAELIIGVVRLT